MMARRFLAAAFLLCSIGFAGLRAAAQDAQVLQDAQAGAPAADRYAQVFDRAGDQGKLVARFLRLNLGADSEPGSGDKSGDSSILISPDGKVMLIDAGSPECGPQVEAALRALGVTKLDAVVASHPHIDHIGGLGHILAAFPVDTLYLGRVTYPTSIFGYFMTVAKKRAGSIVYLEEGAVFTFGDSVDVRVLNPEKDIVYYDGYPSNSTQFINNRSLVLKFTYGEASMLFMGDVYTPRESELIEKFGDRLKADVIKVGHHGSDTSSSKAFVKQVSPKVAVMMHDSFASLQVYKNYRKVEAMAYATAIDGSVKVAIDAARNWSVVTQFDRMSDFLK